MKCYRDAYSHVEKRLSEEAVRLKVDCVVAGNKSENEANNFLRGLVFSMKDCVSQHIACAQDSANEHSSTVVEILRSVENVLHDVVSRSLVLDDGPLNTSRAFPSHDVFMLT